jgi:AGZA family xanthine/uracil permease-like MFS transporter
MLERLFHLSENKTNVRTELFAGTVTFLTMAYIIFVQPAVLSGKMFGMETGMDFGAVAVATCVSAAIATLIMALFANYPVALAPGMGENFLFVFSAIPAATAAGFQNGWQVALGVIFISGVLFFALYLLGVREALIDAISPSMKNAIAVGIGLFIAFIGLQNTGLILKSQATGVTLNAKFASPDIIIFFLALFLTAVLHVRRVPGSILWGILAATVLSITLRLALPACPETISGSALVKESMLMTRFELAEGKQVVSMPPSVAPTFLKMDLVHALAAPMIPFIIIFLFMDVFDTIGTLIGVGEQAGMIKDNKLVRANRALLSDATGTVIGAAMGTSTVTSFIESSAGVEQGGRTGLTSLTTAVFFLLALFFSPIIHMVGSYAPITAPALVSVGAMMIRNVTKVDWNDMTECLPAFLIIIGIPFSYSISDGLALGFIAYPVVKSFGQKGKDVNWLMYTLAVVLVAYFLFVRASL